MLPSRNNEKRRKELLPSRNNEKKRKKKKCFLPGTTIKRGKKLLPSRNNEKKEKEKMLPSRNSEKRKEKKFSPSRNNEEKEKEKMLPYRNSEKKEEKTCYLPGTTRPPSQFPPPPLLGIIVICFWENGEIYEREEMQSTHWDTIGIPIRDGFTLSWGRQCCSCLWYRSNGISQMTARTKHFSHSYGTDIFLV